MFRQWGLSVPSWTWSFPIAFSNDKYVVAHTRVSGVYNFVFKIVKKEANHLTWTDIDTDNKSGSGDMYDLIAIGR